MYIQEFVSLRVQVSISMDTYMAVSHLLLCMICAPLIFGLSGLAFPHFGGKGFQLRLKLC